MSAIGFDLVIEINVDMTSLPVAITRRLLSRCAAFEAVVVR